MSRRAAWLGGGVAAAVVVALVVVWVVVAGSAEHDAMPAPTPAPSASPTPDPSPTQTAPAPNTRAYEQGDLQVVSVREILPQLPVDDAQDEPTTGEQARPAAATGAPVFADPAGEPVAWLPQEQRFDGTTVPIVERQGEWLKVLLVGRQAPAGSGDPSQLAGWLRADDVEVSENPTRVEVDLAARTIDIVTVTADGETRETIASDFASGTAATPTPEGRSFIMLTEVVDSLAYARGNPIVYLSEQSPTLAGFDGDSAAVTAFHYHDVRSGEISNGCLRVGEDVIARLAELPTGTPVHIS